MHLTSSSSKPVAVWILTGIVMLLIQVALGGITRLTGSGLSITEWNIITGALPPLNEQQWLTVFSKYKQTPQFQLLNIDFTLSDFKFIFFWEWLHRFWARLIGIVFITGFIYLVARKYLKKDMQKPLLILFLLGALQGAIGWIMVASGLTGDAVYVKPTRLALHFVFALGLIAYAFWFFLQLQIPHDQKTVNRGIRQFTLVMLCLLAIQLVFGALMAGHKAATAAPTWPDINGAIFPNDLFREKPALLNFIDNKITIHFVHRTLAYVLFILTLAYTRTIHRLPVASPSVRKFRNMPMILVAGQVILGIFSLLASPGIIPGKWGAFEWLALLHQVIGMLLVLSFIALLFLFPVKTSPIKS